MKYKIEVSVRDAKKALDIIQDSPFLRKQINEEATNYYSTSKEDVAEELHESLKQAGVEILSSNVYASNGAIIPNNYEGKTPEQVWNAWTEDQRDHFLKDHFKDKINPISQSEIIKSNYSGLFNWWNFKIKEKLEEHLKTGQYGKGGEVDDFDASHTVKIHKDMPYMASLDGMYDKELPVVEEKTYHFASGPQIYYVVKFNGKLTEIPRRFTEAGYNEMAGKGAHLEADEFQEAAELYKIEVSVRDAKKALDIIQDSPFLRKQINEEATNYYSTSKQDVAEELHESLKQAGVEILSSNVYAGNGAHLEADEFQEAAEFLMDKTVFSYSLGQLEPTEHKIKGVHITPKHFNQRHLYFSFYGNEWPHNFNDSDRLTADQLGDFIAGEQVELKDSQGEPYIVALGDIASKGTKITVPRMEPEELTDVLYSKENNWADIGQAQMYVYQTPSVSDYLKRLHIIDLTGQSASKIKYPDGVYVFIAKVGNRYYYVNTEGYDYARYAVEIPGWFAREINMEKAAKGTKIESLNIGDEVEFINDSGVTKSRGKIIDIDSDGKYATIDWKDGTHLFYRNINKIWKYNDQAAKGTKIENMDFETRFSKFIKELSWLSNKTGVVIGGHYNDALGEYIEYTNDWTSGDIWRGGKSRETTDAPKGYYRFIKGLEAISNKYGIEVHSTGHVITEHNGMVKYTDDPTSGDINYKELNGKGSKIKENMENKNYYYLKIGNIITDSKNNVYEITGYKKDGILMKRISDFTPGDGVPFETEFEELESKLKSKLVKISTVKHVRDSLNNVLRSINEDLIFSTSRDEALLEMEIADIKNSFKIAEEKAEVRKKEEEVAQAKHEADVLLKKAKAEVRKKEEEVAQAKHEADVLLKKATDTEAAAKDTIEAMEAMITEERHGWQIGKIADYDFEAKVFEQPSEYGINNGRISKLWVYKKVNGKKNTAINYDRGWDIRPTTVKDKKVLKTILSMFPVNADQAGKGKKVGYNPDMFYKKGEEVKVLTGYYKGKNGIVHDVDHDANHIEVEMGDGMIRFLELSDVKKNESNEHKAGKGKKVGGIFKHTEDTYLPDAYYKEFTLKGNRGRKYNIFQSHGSSQLSQAVKQLFPTISKGKHEELAVMYAKEEAQAQKEYNELVKSAFKEQFGREYEAMDYKVSGIVRDEFPEKVKDKLRELVKKMNEYEAAKTLHEAGVGKTFSVQAGKGKKVGGIFKHTEDTYLPDAYYKEFTLKGNRGRKYNIFQSHGSSELRQAVNQLFPSISKSKHEELAVMYAKEEAQAQKEYNDLVKSAFKEQFGREYEAMDYKVSGIVRDEFPEKVKDKLRELVKKMNEYEAAKTLHEAGVGRTFSVQAGKGKKVGDLATLTEEENKAWQTAFEYYLNEGKSDSQADKLAWKDLQAEFPRLKDFSGIKEDKSPVQEDFYQAKKSKTQKGKWAILKNGEVIEDGLDEYFAGTTANKRNAEIEYAKIDSQKPKAEKPKASKGSKLFKKEAKIGKYYHFRLNNPKGVKKCAVPSWASDLAGSVYEGAKITTCQKDGEWFAQNVMIPTKNISKLQARSYAQQIALKIKK